MLDKWSDLHNMGVQIPSQNSLLEWTGLDTSTTISRRNAVQEGGESLGTVVCLIDTVATHGIV
jgi:hypothetical protein